MPDRPKPPIDDRERLQRYLQWRERNERPAQHAVHRRRVRGALAGAAVGLVGVALLAWVSYGSRHPAATARRDAPSVEATRAADVARATEATRATSDATGATETAGASQPHPAPPPVIERAPEAPTPQAPAMRRPGSAKARTTARAAAPDRVRATPAEESTAPRTDSPPVPDNPSVAQNPSAAPTPAAADTPRVAPTPPVAENAPAAQTPPVAQTPAAVQSGTVTSIESKPACADVIGGESPDGRPRSQRVAGCVGGWFRSQTQELRDGVKREADDFRGGVDRVGRALQWLGSKLRRPE